MRAHLPNIDTAALSRRLLLGGWHPAKLGRVVDQHAFGVLEIRVRHDRGGEGRSVGVGGALARSSIAASPVGGQALAGCAVGKVVLDVSIEKQRRKKEVENADQHANDAGGYVNDWLVAGVEDAELRAKLALAASEAVGSGVNDGEDVQRAVDYDLDPDSGDEEHESIVVLHTNTIVDPRTVVIKSLDALVADGAVAGAGGLDDFALGAEVSWIDIPQQLKERSRLLWHDRSWILARRVEEAQEDDHGGNSACK